MWKQEVEFYRNCIDPNYRFYPSKHRQDRINCCSVTKYEQAFDSIDHDILILKLRDVGLSSSSIDWFKSYLSSRYQVVKIQASISDQVPVTSGVPQGSILGPLLFSIYTNDLALVPKHCSTQSYVDDTKLLLNFRLKDQQNTFSKLNEDLQRICKWTFTNKLLLNPDKTKFVIFGSRP